MVDVPAVLLELELRLEALLDDPQFSWSLSAPREIFRAETCMVLVEHGLDHLARWDPEQLVESLLERDPMPLVLGLPELLLGGCSVGPIAPELLERVLPWALGPAIPRNPRDALALLVAVPTLADAEPGLALRMLRVWCGGAQVPFIRFGLVTLVGLVTAAPTLIATERPQLVELCCALGRVRDRELVTAVGWALRELVTESPTVTLGLLEAEVARLSRAVLRITVERLPHCARTPILSAYQASRAQRSIEPTAQASDQRQQFRVSEQPSSDQKCSAEAEHGE